MSPFRGFVSNSFDVPDLGATVSMIPRHGAINPGRRDVHYQHSDAEGSIDSTHWGASTSCSEPQVMLYNLSAVLKAISRSSAVHKVVVHNPVGEG